MTGNATRWTRPRRIGAAAVGGRLPGRSPDHDKRLRRTPILIFQSATNTKSDTKGGILPGGFTSGTRRTKMWNTIIAVVIGGLISSLSGIAAVYFQAISTKRKRMDEIIAEKKVEADSQAYRDMKKFEYLLLSKKSCSAIISWMESRQEWFFSNRLFLPGEYPAKWLIIRNKLIQTAMPEPKDLPIKAGSEIEKFLLSKAAEAIDEVYKDTGQKRIVLASAI